MPHSRKEEFNNWLVSVFKYLQAQYLNCDLWLETESLKKTHWYRLWRIFENYVEAPHQGSKELMEALEVATYEAGEVVLDAHGKNYSELNW